MLNKNMYVVIFWNTATHKAHKRGTDASLKSATARHGRRKNIRTRQSMSNEKNLRLAEEDESPRQAPRGLNEGTYHAYRKKSRKSIHQSKEHVDSSRV